MNKARIFVGILTLLVCQVVLARDITYVGDGRYICSGKHCDTFNARERQIQDRRDQERRYTDSEQRARQREREESDRYGLYDTDD